MRGVSFDTNEVAWLLGAACQLHRIPFDPKLVLGQHPPPHTLESLREALKALGLRSGIETLATEQLSLLSGPSFAALKRHDSDELRLVLLLRYDGDPDASPKVAGLANDAWRMVA